VGPGAGILSILILLSLRYGLFPFWYDGHSASTYWLMAIAGTVGMFLSLLAHDCAHILAEKIFLCKPRSVNFYMFGDVSLGDEPTNRKVEWKVAFAGPIVSLILGLALFGTSLASDMHAFPQPWVGVLFHLAAANLTLAFFNFLPFFPLDGGRVVRATLWRRKRNFVKANYLALRGGLFLSLILIFGGLLLVLDGKLLIGGWILGFGVALGFAAHVNREAVKLRHILKGNAVRSVMNTIPISISPSISLEKLAEDYFDRYKFPSFPVVQDYDLVGLISKRDLGKMPRDSWKSYKVSEITNQSSDRNTVRPDTNALHAFDLLKENGLDLVLVADHGRLVGIVTRGDLWTFSVIEDEDAAESKDAA
jgi:Zn-dependent protease/CBS domain-containing protein